jgi:hypothetical protein
MFELTAARRTSLESRSLSWRRKKSETDSMKSRKDLGKFSGEKMKNGNEKLGLTLFL